MARIEVRGFFYLIEGTEGGYRRYGGIDSTFTFLFCYY